MVQRVQVQLVDDLNGEQAQETIRFGLDGTSYDIDLTTENADALRSTLVHYVSNARKAGNGRRRHGFQKSTSKPTNRGSHGNTTAIRQWAQDHGYTPSSRGRIPQSIIDAYNNSR